MLVGLVLRLIAKNVQSAVWDEANLETFGDKSIDGWNNE